MAGRSPLWPPVWSSGWIAPPSRPACRHPHSCTFGATPARCWRHQAGATWCWSRSRAPMQTWDLPGFRCWMRWVAWPDASARALGGGALADVHHRILGPAHPADDHLGTGRSPAWILSVGGGDDRSSAGRGDRGFDRGARSNNGNLPVCRIGTRGKPAELHAVRLRHAAGAVDWPGGFRIGDIGGTGTALFRPDGRGTGSGCPTGAAGEPALAGKLRA